MASLAWQLANKKKRPNVAGNWVSIPPRLPPQHSAPPAHPAATQPASAPPQPPAPPPAATGSGSSWQDDPILSQIKGLSQMAIENARATALDAKKQLLEAYGYDPTVAGLFPDEMTAAAAKANPFSTLANLAFAHQQREKGLNENLNQGNLWYSGYRGTQLGLEARNTQVQQAEAAQHLREALTNIAGQLSAAELAEQQRQADAAAAAWDRWWQQHQNDPPPTSTTPPAAPPPAAPSQSTDVPPVLAPPGNWVRDIPPRKPRNPWVRI